MITEQQVRDALRNVYDPEVDHNVQDLGLIYSVEIDGGHVSVIHSLTSAMCPFAEEICAGIEEAVAGIPGVERVTRTLTFDPPFTIDMVPEETRLAMGWF
jgi:metal-sulfur cluster biosynthetic enzyme